MTCAPTPDDADHHSIRPVGWTPQVEQDAAESLVSCPACHTAADAVTAEPAAGPARITLLRLGLSIFFAMNVMVFTMALWSQDLYPDGEPDQLANTLRALFRYLALLFSLPVLFLLGGPILQRVWHACRAGTITTDLLIMLGVVAAYLYSALTVIRGSGHVYFEVGCMVLIFVTIGRWLEASGRQRTNDALDSLAKLLPDTARRVRDGKTTVVPRDQLNAGDFVRTVAGERFGVDGQITDGNAEVDEQILTGESMTVRKKQGDKVYSGTLNIDGVLLVKVINAPGQETVSRMLALVQSARQAKGRHARLADRVASWFVPSVFLVAIAAAWWHGQAAGLDAGILTGLAVVLIACPCALGLATPLAIWTALGIAAREQVLFRSGQSLEDLAAVKAVRFDKTGTLTSGQTAVAEFFTADESPSEEVLQVAVALASASTHSLSAAIVRETEDLPNQAELTDVATHPGRGITARLADSGDLAALGSRRLMTDYQITFDTNLQEIANQAGARQSPFSCVAFDGRVRGVFIFEETIRSETPDALARCQQLNLDMAVLTGDHRQRAELIAQSLGIPVEAELLPEEKVTAVEQARQEFGSVAMVGDGLNDAPALAAADVGVAMGCGADLSRESADVCLLSDNLVRFGWTVALARRTVRIIRQNLFWAFFYNFGGIGLAVTGRLNPMWAAGAMALSSFFVVTNSLRLTRFPLPQETTPKKPATRVGDLERHDVHQSTARIPSPS